MRIKGRSLTDPVRLRAGAWVLWATTLVGVLIVVRTQTFYYADQSPFRATLASPVFALLTWRIPRLRSEALAAGAAVVAFWAPPGGTYVWPLIAAFSLLATVEERRRVVVSAWVGGVAGAVLAIMFNPASASPVPFLAVGLGGGVGLLIRYRMRVTELVERADELSGQARWLEQRAVMARELHDVIGHQVTAIVIQAEAGLVTDAEGALRAIGALGRTALGELDSMVDHLRDLNTDLQVSAPPQLSDIDELLAAPLRLQGVATTVHISADVELNDVQALTVYRIVQEALTNVARHAQATESWVEVVRLDRHLRVRVTDNGVGPPSTLDPVARRGSGLIGIRERVAAQAGSWELAGRLGGSTVIDVVLPLEPRL
ncbi:sensor histidine kinase [Aeromicrobium sp. 9AM]|uniref:sensor histidine kinase n=1 Tax=Aeromicrobium sp. 9AM TaxID=2653126 RepID=UPI00135A3400|nr:ATP-binding protein [Aeromicrobium sp. 9AM]